MSRSVDSLTRDEIIVQEMWGLVGGQRTLTVYGVGHYKKIAIDGLSKRWNTTQCRVCGTMFHAKKKWIPICKHCLIEHGLLTAKSVDTIVK